MIRGIDSAGIFSPNAEKLAEFYRETVGLEQTMEAKIGEEGEKLYGFETEGSSDFYIADHSGVKGKSKEPARIMINFEVDDVEKETERLDEAKVKKIQDIYHVEGYGLITTFQDPDGNYFQLVQVGPS